MTPQHKQSRFIFDWRTFEIVWGRAPKKQGQLWKGETLEGKKMELAGHELGPVAYDDWSP